MKSMRLAGGLLVVGLMFGCHAKKEVAAPPADAQTLQEARTNYQKLEPKARVGLVIAAKPELNLVSVGDIEVQDFKVGDAITFTDSRSAIVGSGVVIRKTEDALHVRYETPVEPARAPQAGDLAVRLVK